MSAADHMPTAATATAARTPHARQGRDPRTSQPVRPGRGGQTRQG